MCRLGSRPRGADSVVDVTHVVCTTCASREMVQKHPMDHHEALRCPARVYRMRCFPWNAWETRVCRCPNVTFLAVDR